MNLQSINIGTFANDGSGDDLRTAFTKVTNNFSILSASAISNGQNLGSGSPIFAGTSGDKLTFRSIKQGTNVNVSYDSTSITIAADDLLSSLSQDPSPQLGANLDLNGYTINGLAIDQGTGTVTLSAGEGTLQADISGTLYGNVYGTINDISNHDIGDLGNVSSAAPVSGQSLVWTGSEWAPAGAGLEFTVGTDWEFPGFDGAFRTPIQYLLGIQDQDMGTFDSPSSLEFNLGTF
jgi:hypothetical protein